MAEVMLPVFMCVSDIFAFSPSPPLPSGPVRGVDFHPNQPLFVSGGDDYKIKVSTHVCYLLPLCTP